MKGVMNIHRQSNKYRSYHSRDKYGFLQGKPIVRVLITTLFILPLLQLLSPNSHLPAVNASSLAEGYPTSENLIEGALVVLSNETPPRVGLANLNNSEYLVGVVERDGEGLITLNKDGAEVLVATSGEIFAFVSDVNGDINPGDFIGTSWINGVGMKEERIQEQKLLGVALESFNDETTEFIEVESVETANGTKDVRVGKIAVRLFEREVGPDQGGSLSTLEEFAFRLAGQDVPFSRIVAAFGLFTISVIISGVFLANAIRSSLISIGRNPLAHSPIFNTLMQISGVSIALILIGSLLAYVVLII